MESRQDKRLKDYFSVALCGIAAGIVVSPNIALLVIIGGATPIIANMMVRRFEH